MIGCALAVFLVCPLNICSAQYDFVSHATEDIDKILENLLHRILSPSGNSFAESSPAFDDVTPIIQNFTGHKPVTIKLSDETLSQTKSTDGNIVDEIEAGTNRATRNPGDSKLALKLTRQEIHRKKRIQRCLSMYYRMPVDTEDWRPWTIMHGLLPYGKQSQVAHRGKHYNAAEYLCHNAIGNDTYMLYVENGAIAVRVGPGVQGHDGQFLAMLAQADVPSNQTIDVQGQKFTVADLVQYEKLSCRQQTELTFKLIGLSHYLESDDVWQNSIGQSWNVERLIYEEIKQPINGAACGGTHRLMGLSYAVKQRRVQDKPIDGQWARAQNFIGKYQDYAMRFQNPDGSFSTNWFVTQEADADIIKRLYTTGHLVEWLAFSLPDNKLNDPKFTYAVDYLLGLMFNAPALDLEIGPKGHALHALRVYETRVFGKNSNVEDVSPADLALVKKAKIQQEQMKPQFDIQENGNIRAQRVSFPGAQQGGRRIFRRR